MFDQQSSDLSDGYKDSLRDCRPSLRFVSANVLGAMRFSWSALTLCLVVACASWAECQYGDSLEDRETSSQEEESASQEAIDGDDMETDDSGGDAVTAASDARDEQDITTIVYRSDEEDQSDEDSAETTTTGRIPDRFVFYPNNRRFPLSPTQEQRKDAPRSGNPYIGYQGEYRPYPALAGRYFGQFPRQYYPSDRPPQSSLFNLQPQAAPDNSLNHNDQFRVAGNDAGPEVMEGMPSEDDIPPGKSFDYLRKLRNIVILDRLRKHYGFDIRPPFMPAQPVATTVTRVISTPDKEPAETFRPKMEGHNLTQMMFEEMETLRGRLRAMELERIKMRTILIQLKSILNEMHEHSTMATTSGNRPTMSQYKMRIARLRNLFLILNAVTRLTPLTAEELDQINYDVGLFDPKISDDSKSALINRMALLLRRKGHGDTVDAAVHPGTNNAGDRIFTMTPKNQASHLRNEPNSPGELVHLSANAFSPQTPQSDSDESHDRRNALQCKLRRLRNLYLLVRPFVTGTRLSREELREIFHSHEGFFEPGLTEAQKIALVSKMAETIRIAHISRQLILNSSANATSSTSGSSTESPGSTTSSSEQAPIPAFARPSIVVIAQRMNSEANRPPADRMHVSGKIQMDLNIEGNIDPSQEGLLSRLL